MFTYAGIGSRKTPTGIQQLMRDIAMQLAPLWKLHSGFAAGADQAFAVGAAEANGEMVNFIPWEGFNGAPFDDQRFVCRYSHIAMKIAAQYHPNWDACSSSAKLLHARNVFQVLGEDLESPVDMVICWTPNGKRGGGTGQALRIAEAYQIPIFDLAVPIDKHRLCNFTQEIEATAVKITVVNKHHNDVGEHIGRGSPLGNPWSHMAGTSAAYQVDTRDEAINNYRKWLEEQITEGNSIVINELDRLAGIAMVKPLVLQCYCKPAACHGDVIADVLTKAIMQHRKP